MSLLLDALKRSEKARQEREARGEQPPGPEETREFSLEALEEEARELRESGEFPAPPREERRPGQPAAGRSERARVAETAERSAVQPPQPDAGHPEADHARTEDQDDGYGGTPRRLVEDTVEGFPDLEIVEQDPDDTSHLSLEMDPGREDERARADTGSVERPAFSLLDEEEPARRDRVADTNSSGSLPDADEARASVDRYFDGTQSMSVSMREVKRAIETGDDEEAPDATGAGRTSTTQRRARTVVEARTAATRARGRSGNWLWLGVLVVVGLLAGGGAWYYLNFIDRGPALFAGGTPPPAPRPAPPAPRPEQAPEAAGGTPQTAGAPSAATAQTEPPTASLAELEAMAAALPEPPPRGELAPGAEPGAQAPEPAIEPPAPPVEQVLTEPEPGLSAPDGPVTPEGVQDRLARAIANAGVGGTAPSGIRITRNTRRDTVSPQLARAFDAFQDGDVAAARQAYQAVLARSPGNRDALLGLAAVNMQEGDQQRAGELYLQVLRDHPRDRVARASVIALSDRLDPVEAESRVKGLIEADPDLPHLRFLLGNVYAAQSRWALAQEAYFQAWRLDGANPDYAFNLAVSLDHLAQRQAALEYYQRALELADRRRAGFEPAAVMQRIRVMTADASVQ